MALIIQSSRPVFDTSQIEKGHLIYARHRSWEDGLAGIVTGVSEDRLVVQYHPAMADELGGELAEELMQVFENMPAKGV